MASTRCGISAKQLERELGVTYKCAWRMFNLIRSLLDEDGDQTVWQSRNRRKFFRRKRRQQTLEQATFLQERSSRQNSGLGRRRARRPRYSSRRARHHSTHILPHLRERIMPRSVVFTDEARIYRNLPRLGYDHQRVYHSAGIYVDGDAHTNTIEGFWSLTKNGIRGVYHNVSTKHLQSYLNEYAFRFNRRKSLGKRNMFDAFIRKDQEGCLEGSGSLRSFPWSVRSINSFKLRICRRSARFGASAPISYSCVVNCPSL